MFCLLLRRRQYYIIKYLPTKDKSNIICRMSYSGPPLPGGADREPPSQPDPLALAKDQIRKIVSENEPITQTVIFGYLDALARTAEPEDLFHTGFFLHAIALRDWFEEDEDTRNIVNEHRRYWQTFEADRHIGDYIMIARNQHGKPLPTILKDTLEAHAAYFQAERLAKIQGKFFALAQTVASGKMSTDAKTFYFLASYAAALGNDVVIAEELGKGLKQGIRLFESPGSGSN